MENLKKTRMDGIYEERFGGNVIVERRSAMSDWRLISTLPRDGYVTVGRWYPRPGLIERNERSYVFLLEAKPESLTVKQAVSLDSRRYFPKAKLFAEGENLIYLCSPSRQKAAQFQAQVLRTVLKAKAILVEIAAVGMLHSSWHDEDYLNLNGMRIRGSQVALIQQEIREHLVGRERIISSEGEDYELLLFRAADSKWLERLEKTVTPFTDMYGYPKLRIGENTYTFQMTGKSNGVFLAEARAHQESLQKSGRQTVLVGEDATSFNIYVLQD